jgi:Holliday junction resolvase-like predicted endonuclease
VQICTPNHQCVEKLTQSWKLMWRNWHNHENLCGEIDTITKTYVEKLISFHDCVSFFTLVFMIVSVSPHKFSWLCQFLCGETDTIMKTYVEKLTQSLKFMWRNWQNHENLFGETDTIMKTYVEKLKQSRKLIYKILPVIKHGCYLKLM